MSFLFPLYFLGALAVAIPIVLHLRRRPARDRIEFSSTLFLDAQDPPHRRSSRIEQWILLALRCAALLLLALLFSRPWWRGTADAMPPTGTVRLIVLDQSGSMRQAGAWEAALAEARRVIAEAKEGDRVALGAFDQDLALLVPFAPGPTSAAVFDAALKELSPGWGGTALDEALVTAVGLVEEAKRGQKADQEIVLISDFQEGAARDRLQSFSWPGEVRLRGIAVPAATEVRDNASIQVVAAAEDEETGEISGNTARAAEVIRLRVTRSGSGAEKSVLTVRWKNHPSSALEVHLPPGASRVLTAPPRPAAEATELELIGDAEAFDNRAFVAPRRARVVRVLMAGETADPETAESPLFFLSRTLGATASLRPEINAKRIAELTAADWQEADVAVVSGALQAGAATAARGFVEAGGLMVLLLPDAGAGAWLSAADPGFTVAEASVADHVLLEGLDFDHPVLRPFATPGLRDFSKIHTWRYRRLGTPEGARILARFDSGDPAFVEWATGKGRIYVSAMSWIPADSQLPLSSKFVPLVYGLLGEAGFQHRETDRCLVGEELPGAREGREIVTPNGTALTAPFRTLEPGIYLVKNDKEERAIACNLAPNESRLEAFPPASLAGLGVAVENVVSAANRGATLGAEEAGPRIQMAEWEQQQKLWKWFLPVLLAVLLGETWWANRPRLKAGT